MLGLGLATMLVGGWRALRQNDLKLLLAYGTVSQLGFLIVLVGAGSRELAAAGAGDVVAHALFKATLFLVVGIVDHATGTRDLRRLSGLGRRLPVLAAVGRARRARRWPACRRCSASSPRRRRSTALLDGGLADRTVAAARARRARRRLGAHRRLHARASSGARSPPSPGLRADRGRTHPPGALFLAAPSSCWPSPGWSLGPASPLLEPLVAAYADALPLMADEPSTWRSGTADPRAGACRPLTLLRRRRAVRRARAGRPACSGASPSAPSADEGYWTRMQGLDRSSVEVTGATQRGSLPVYLGTILVVVLALPGRVLLTRAPWPERVAGLGHARCRRWSARVVARRRASLALRDPAAALRRSLLVGVTGYGLAVLFVLHGAPDLALTQFLVETVTLVVFVLVLRRLPKDFSDGTARRERRGPRGHRRRRRRRSWPSSAPVALAGRTAHAGLGGLPRRRRYEFGGGSNIVNVTLVDIRAWDTMGEISVLVVAATGVASLIFLRRRTGTVDRRDPADAARGSPADGGRRGGSGWPAAVALPPERRSVVFEVVTRLLFHTDRGVLASTCCSPATTTPAAGSPAGWSPGWRWCSATWPAAGTSSARPRRSTRGCCSAPGCCSPAAPASPACCSGAEVLQTAILETTLPLLGRRQARHVAVLRHRRLPGRRRPGARRAAQPRRGARPPGGRGRPDRGRARRGDRPMTPTVVLPWSSAACTPPASTCCWSAA